MKAAEVPAVKAGGCSRRCGQKRSRVQPSSANQPQAVYPNAGASDRVSANILRIGRHAAGRPFARYGNNAVRTSARLAGVRARDGTIAEPLFRCAAHAPSKSSGHALRRTLLCHENLNAPVAGFALLARVAFQRPMITPAAGHQVFGIHPLRFQIPNYGQGSLRR